MGGVKTESIMEAVCETCGHLNGNHYGDDTCPVMKNGVWMRGPMGRKFKEKGSDHVLPTDSEERKEIPLFSGVLNYFPLALAAVARHSKKGSEKHHPGEPLHWERGKSDDHLDCIARHTIDVETVNAAGEYEEATALAWRALANLQLLEEKRLGKPPSRGSK